MQIHLATIPKWLPLSPSTSYGKATNYFLFCAKLLATEAMIVFAFDDVRGVMAVGKSLILGNKVSRLDVVWGVDWFGKLFTHFVPLHDIQSAFSIIEVQSNRSRIN